MLLFSDCTSASSCAACQFADAAVCTSCNDGDFLDATNANVCSGKVQLHNYFIHVV